jgi:NADPH:quinone reductase-like Zn-dependent oxidoreductase
MKSSRNTATYCTTVLFRDKMYIELRIVPRNRSSKLDNVAISIGSTSVGSNAIQLAVAASYKVITAASPKNFDYVKKLGASQVFDYHSKTVVHDLINAFKGKTIAGALATANTVRDGKTMAEARAIGNRVTETCLGVVDMSKGDKFYL